MPVTLLALQIVLILLPGFSAAYGVQALSTRRSQSDFERVIEAVVFSFIVYVLYTPLNRGNLPFHILRDPTGKSEDTIVWEPAHLIWLAAVTGFFTLFAVAYLRYDGNRLFRCVGLTEQIGRASCRERV